MSLVRRARTMITTFCTVPSLINWATSLRSGARPSPLAAKVAAGRPPGPLLRRLLAVITRVLKRAIKLGVGETWGTSNGEVRVPVRSTSDRSKSRLNGASVGGRAG